MEESAQAERIVVGVDGSEGSRRALAWAADEAHRRGATLVAVCAWQYPVVLTSAAAVTVPDEPYEEAARQTLGEELAEVLGPSPEVPVEQHLVMGPPAEALVEASQGASMVVVGSRGRGGFTGLLLGSVSQQCAHHARCPVVIVPPEH